MPLTPEELLRQDTLRRALKELPLQYKMIPSDRHVYDTNGYVHPYRTLEPEQWDLIVDHLFSLSSLQWVEFLYSALDYLRTHNNPVSELEILQLWYAQMQSPIYGYGADAYWNKLLGKCLQLAGNGPDRRAEWIRAVKSAKTTQQRIANNEHAASLWSARYQMKHIEDYLGVEKATVGAWSHRERTQRSIEDGRERIASAWKNRNPGQEPAKSRMDTPDKTESPLVGITTIEDSSWVPPMPGEE